MPVRPGQQLTFPYSQPSQLNTHRRTAARRLSRNSSSLSSRASCCLKAVAGGPSRARRSRPHARTPNPRPPPACPPTSTTSPSCRGLQPCAVDPALSCRVRCVLTSPSTGRACAGRHGLPSCRPSGARPDAARSRRPLFSPRAGQLAVDPHRHLRSSFLPLARLLLARLQTHGKLVLPLLCLLDATLTLPPLSSSLQLSPRPSILQRGPAINWRRRATASGISSLASRATPTRLP